MKRTIPLLLLALLGCGVMVVRAALFSDAGLHGRFTAARAWGVDTRTRTSRQLDAGEIERAWSYAPPARFRAEWTGYLAVPATGWYRFATAADDSAAVTIDGLPVAGMPTAESRIRLARGSHPITIRYEQLGGAYAVDVQWAADQGALRRVPRWAFWTRPVGAVRATAARMAAPAPALAGFVLLFAALWVYRAELARAAARVRHLDPALVLVLLFGAYFRLMYIDLPLADAHGWRQLFNADVARNFAEGSMNIWSPHVSWGGGGDDRVSMEFPLISWLAALVVRVVGQGSFDLVCRLVALVFSMATMIGIYGLGTMLWGRAVGRGAAFLLAISPSAIFFGRAFISDTPMVCFSAFGVWGFVSYLKTDRRAPLVWGTIAAALACMVKLPAVVLFAPVAWMGWEVRRWSVLKDTRFLTGMAAAMLATIVWYGHAELVFLETYLGVAIFHPVGGYSPEIMQGAGPLTLVTSWNTKAQLSNPEYYTALGDRFWRLHFTPVGTVGVLAGALVRFRATHRRFVDVWWAAVALFILIAAEGNRWHEFYQLPILLPAALYFGLAAEPLFDGAWLSRLLPRRLAVPAVVALLAYVGVTGFERSGVVSELFRPFALRMWPIHLGQQLQELTPPDALIVTVEYEQFGGNSPTVLYNARRRGWSFDAMALTPEVLQRLESRFGAAYFVSPIWPQLAERRPELAAYLQTKRSIPLSGGDAALFALR